MGLDPVTNFVLNDVIPNGLTLINASPGVGTWTEPNWYVGTLNAGDLFTMVLETTVDELPYNSPVTSFINTVTKEAVAASDGSYDTLGEIITYEITVTNAGVSTLSNINITDPNADLGSITPPNVASLAPAASVVFTVKHTINASDLSAFQVVNIATAQAELPNGFVIYDTSDDPNDTTNYDANGDGDPDDATVTKLQKPSKCHHQQTNYI